MVRINAPYGAIALTEWRRVTTVLTVSVFSLCWWALVLSATLAGCRADCQLGNHQPPNTPIADSVPRAATPGQPDAPLRPKAAPIPTLNSEADNRLQSNKTVRETVEFSTCPAAKREGINDEEEQGDGLVECALSSGLIAQQGGPACFDVNRLLDTAGDVLFDSWLVGPKGMVFVVDTKFEVYRCQGHPFAVLQSGQFFTAEISNDSPCHGKKPLRRAYVVQDVLSKKRYDDVSLKRAQALLLQVARITKCGNLGP